jgi:hypothetical protein
MLKKSFGAAKVTSNHRTPNPKSKTMSEIEQAAAPKSKAMGKEPCVYDPLSEENIPLSRALVEMTDAWMEDNCSAQTGIDLLDIAGFQREQLHALKHAILAAIGYIQGGSILDKDGILKVLTEAVKPLL